MRRRVPLTNRLYYTDSYLRQFEAGVTERSDDATRIYLDQTAFYPTSGGQPFDTGDLGGVRVVDVVDEGERIAHLLAAPLLDLRVTARIDWPRRFDHMQQHTGQHLLSAVIAELLGRTTLAVHFGQEVATVDLSGDPLTAAEVSQVERRANEIVTENRPVAVHFQESGAVEGLRKPSSREGTLRIVTIQDLDRSACGGTHVRATGEIGSILLRKVERARRGMRLEFVCGGRAVDQARFDFDTLTRIAAELTASPRELPGVVEAMRSEVKDLRVESQELHRELNRLKARELYSGTPPGPDGIRRILCRDTAALEELRGLGQAVGAMPLTIFIGTTSVPPAVILAVSPDSGRDAGKMLKRLLAAAGGKGGGSALLAQGVLTEAAQLEQVIGSLLRAGSGESA